MNSGTKSEGKPIHRSNKKPNRYFLQNENAQSPEKGKKKNKKQWKTNIDGQKVLVHDLSKVTKKSLVKKKQQQKGKDHSRNRNKQQHFKPMRQYDPFPGDAPIAKEKLKKYTRGHHVKMEGIGTKFHQNRLRAEDKKAKQAFKQAARTELLCQEEAGYIEPDEDEETFRISQHEIARNVDITSAQKFFELELNKFGPYRVNYTRNGRFMLMGGGKGHVAAFDWQTKKLMCEMNVMETVNDIKWLHTENMFAVAQKQWTYIYDNQGIELHCLKGLDMALRLEFLPYHFLLVSSHAKGYLHYLDVSVGQKVAGFGTGLGRLDVMCQNPSNAIIHLGHSGGTVTLWSPNIKEPLAKMLCHGSGTRSLAVDHSGMYMATSGIDRKLKIWDLRQFKMLQSYKIGAGAGCLTFSQRGLLAAGIGNVVEVYRDCCQKTVTSPYLAHRCQSTVANLQFCPFEDVLGVGHGEGFASLLVPGAGEPNFDAMEVNPYQSKKQRQQGEVKMLLEKVSPDMINLDTSALSKVDTKTLKEKFEDRVKLKTYKAPKIDFEPRHRKKGRSKGAKLEKRKKGVREDKQRKVIKQMKKQKLQIIKDRKEKKVAKPYNVFDRFASKDD